VTNHNLEKTQRLVLTSHTRGMTLLHMYSARAVTTMGGRSAVRHQQ